MEDLEIVALYFDRDEKALTESEQKYRRYCWSIACNILGSEEDAAECVNDVWLAAWDSIPPHRPERLGLYLGKLARRMALRKWRSIHAEKRGGGQTALALEELTECIPTQTPVDDGLLAQAVADGINGFLAGLPATQRQVFVRRYWFLDPVDAIAREMGYSVSKVTSMLHRTRVKLREHLMKEELL